MQHEALIDLYLEKILEANEKNESHAHLIARRSAQTSYRRLASRTGGVDEGS